MAQTSTVDHYVVTDGTQPDDNDIMFSTHNRAQQFIDEANSTDYTTIFRADSVVVYTEVS